ncbi:MAG: hypothetical protein ABI417_09710, partial [Coleofasciculaceae cyanobacterium]
AVFPATITGQCNHISMTDTDALRLSSGTLGLGRENPNKVKLRFGHTTGAARRLLKFMMMVKV